MRYCPEHLSLLEEVVRARGLGSLIPDDATDANRRLMDRLYVRGLNVNNFDPMHAIQEQVFRGVSVASSVIYNPDHAACNPCPLCHILGQYPDAIWIVGEAVNMVLERFQELKA